MWIKPAIVILFLLMVLSLAAGNVFLFRDRGAGQRRRVLWALGIRAGLAVALLSVVAYGMFTGRLHSRAPWAGGDPAPAETPAITPPPEEMPAEPDS